MKYIPSVIEPSFGIGRILYHLLEHSFSVRKEGAAIGHHHQTQSQPNSTDSSVVGGQVLRSVLSLPPFMAPIKVAILPLSSNAAFDPIASSLAKICSDLQLTFKLDSSGVSIGRRYARCDEIGIPFDLTIDFQTINDSTITLRERDSTQQVRIQITEISSLLQQLCKQKPTTNWQQIYTFYPQVARSEAED